MTARDDLYYCGRCALRADWQVVALAAQGLAVRDAVIGTPSGSPPAAAPPGPPADPFAG